jgi:hypothetical protein
VKLFEKFLRIFVGFLEIFLNYLNNSSIKMDSMKKLKLFPDGWYRNMTKDELAESRQQLKAYTVSSTLDKSIKEVICLFLLSRRPTSAQATP